MPFLKLVREYLTVPEDVGTAPQNCVAFAPVYWKSATRQTCARTSELQFEPVGSEGEFQRHAACANARLPHFGRQHDRIGVDRTGNSYRRTLPGRRRAEAVSEARAAEWTVEMKVATVRYESLEDSTEDSGYLIGARILEMSDGDRASFEKYVNQY